MATVTCPTNPSLFIPAIPVQFVDGVAEVPNELLPALAVYTIHGVVIDSKLQRIIARLNSQAADGVEDSDEEPGDDPDTTSEEPPAEPAEAPTEPAEAPAAAKRTTRKAADKPFG